MNKEAKRVAIYVRVSTEDQADHGYSISAQKDALRAYCKQNQMILMEEYVDEGISGKSIEGRYELQRLLADAKTRKFDEVLVWKTNRLARNLLDLQRILQLLERHNVSFRSLTEPFETVTPAGKLLFNVLGSIGEFERCTIVENVKMGMRQRAKEGRWNGGKVLGYASVPSPSDREDRILAVVPDEAAVVRRIFELFAAGKGLKAIASQLNREGVRTKNGNAFGTSAIAAILDNPVYVGKIRYGKYLDWSSKRRKGKSEPVLVDGHHEPIIETELWEKVRSLRQLKSSRPNRTFDGEYPLTGLMRCPACGATMVASRTKNRLRDGTFVIRRYYVCGNFRSKGVAVCRSNGVNADAVEAAVFRRISAAVERPKVLRDVVRRINERRQRSLEPLRKELEALKKSLDKTESSRQKYFRLYEEDTIDKDMLVGRLDELRVERATFEQRRAQIEADLRSCSDEPLPFEVVKEALGHFDRLLLSGSSGQRKTLLQLFLKEIVLTKDRKVERIEIRFDENVEAHLAEEAPSAATGTEGASPRFHKVSRGRVPSFVLTL